MDLSNVDWSVYLDQFLYGCDQVGHWLLNDGSSFSALMIFLILCLVVVAVAARGNKKQLSQDRAGYDVECFVQEMTNNGYDETVCRIVYHYIQSMYRIDFPIMPGDDLYTVFGITEDAAQRSMPVLMQATGRQDRRASRLRKPLNTVKDLVDYVESLPRTLDYVWEHFQTA